MKHSISSLTSISVTTIAVVVLIGSFTTPITQAATTNTGTAVRCPTGYTCVPTVQTVAVVCPTGYVCTPKSTTNTISRPTTAYRPGSYTNLILRPQEQTLTPAQIQAAAQAQGLTLTAAQIQALAQTQTVVSTTATSSGQQLTAAQAPALTVAQMQALASSTTGTSTYAQQVAAQVNAIIARAPTSWPQVSVFRSVDATSSDRPAASYGYYTPATGQHVKSRCGPNQFTSMLANPISCIDNFATNAPIVLNPTVPFDPGRADGGLSNNTITNPYCSGVTAREGNGSSRTKPILLNSNGTTAKSNEGVIDPVLLQEQNCIIGEAYENQPYNNPWVTVNNLFGMVEIPVVAPTDPLRNPMNGPTYKYATNFCKDSITLAEAKRRNDQQLAAGIHNDLYTSNSRLYVPAPYSPSLYDVENKLTYLDHPGTNINYWWNGSQAFHSWDNNYITFYKLGDIKDPEFLALFNAMQIENINASKVPLLMKCMDTGYISNLPPVAGHFQSEIIHDISLGLIQK